MIVVDLSKKLQNIKCGDNDNVHTHFTKLDDLREQLSAMRKILGDNEYALILLRSLPTSYEPTTSVINAAADLSGTDITPDIVTRLVTNKYNQCIIKKGTGKNGPEEAFSADRRKRD